jgi:hypothetical protein
MSGAANGWARASALIACVLGLAACREEHSSAPSGNAAGVSGKGGAASAQSEEAVRQREEAVRKATNPQGLPVYSGPIGSVRGVVSVSGDPAPIAEMAAKLPATGCPGAEEMQRKVYREGIGRTLADVLVTVTEYPGFLPPRGDNVRIDIKGCAFSSRVVAMAFGQRLDVFNLDPQGYLPRLMGTPSYALRLALPGGSPVPLFAPHSGRYLLVDETHEYMSAELYVLNFPTFQVTGLDGRFEISGIPSGDVRVTAFSPLLGKSTEQRIKIQAGASVELKLDIPFSRAEYEAALRLKERETAKAAATRDAGAVHL